MFKVTHQSALFQCNIVTLCLNMFMTSAPELAHETCLNYLLPSLEKCVKMLG